MAATGGFRSIAEANRVAARRAWEAIQEVTDPLITDGSFPQQYPTREAFMDDPVAASLAFVLDLNYSVDPTGQLVGGPTVTLNARGRPQVDDAVEEALWRIDQFSREEDSYEYEHLRLEVGDLYRELRRRGLLRLGAQKSRTALL